MKDMEGRNKGMFYCTYLSLNVLKKIYIRFIFSRQIDIWDVVLVINSWEVLLYTSFILGIGKYYILTSIIYIIFYTVKHIYWIFVCCVRC